MGPAATARSGKRVQPSRRPIAQRAALGLGAGSGHQPLSAAIRNTLLERIIGGHYGAGERLVELQLAREFGSSQAPVREALRELEKAGLVTIRPRRGCFVNDYHARTQHEIYYVRGALEEAASRLAA